MALHRGDDLDDDFMPDETIALSEDEGVASLVGDQGDIGKLLSADEDEDEDETVQVDLPKEPEKKRSKEKEKKREAKEGLLFLSRFTFPRS